MNEFFSKIGKSIRREAFFDSIEKTQKTLTRPEREEALQVAKEIVTEAKRFLPEDQTESVQIVRRVDPKNIILEIMRDRDLEESNTFPQLIISTYWFIHVEYKTDSSWNEVHTSMLQNSYSFYADHVSHFSLTEGIYNNEPNPKREEAKAEDLVGLLQDLRASRPQQQ